MKFILFVEGDAERYVLPDFLKRWLDPKLDQRVGIVAVNFNQPPAKLLDRLYRKKMKRNYQKTVDGYDLFSKLDPEIAHRKCPRLQEMLDEMLRLAKECGN